MLFVIFSYRLFSLLKINDRSRGRKGIGKNYLEWYYFIFNLFKMYNHLKRKKIQINVNIIKWINIFFSYNEIEKWFHPYYYMVFCTNQLDIYFIFIWNIKPLIRLLFYFGFIITIGDNHSAFASKPSNNFSIHS